MISRLIHIDAYEQGIKSVKIIGFERSYLIVELPNKSYSRVFLSNTLINTLNRHVNNSYLLCYDQLIGVELEAVKRYGLVQWEVVDPTENIPLFLLKR